MVENRLRRSHVIATLCACSLGLPFALGNYLFGVRAEAVHKDLHSRRTDSGSLLKQVSNCISSITKESIPAVVSVRCYSTSPDPYHPDGQKDIPPEMMYEEFINRFFGLPMGPPGKQKPSPFRRQAPPEKVEPYLFAFGSGFIIHESGYTVTNAHVVKNADKIAVLLYGEEKEREAQLVGVDADTDLAVIKVEGSNFPYLELGDSDQLQIGEMVIAIGNAHQWTHSVTMGVVSAKGRENLNLNLIEEYIQTDAAINLGNSGGPLLDVDGKVVGVNTAFASNNGSGSIGIGFAIPSNLTRSITQQLIEEGVVRRGFLGVLIKEMTPTTAEAYGLDKPEGFIITEIMEGSAAQRSGMAVGDVLLRVNGRTIKNFQQLRKIFSIHKPGSEVTVTLFRDGKLIDVTVVLDADNQITTDGAQNINELGLLLENHELILDNGKKEFCVRVKEVAPESPAAKSGINLGDLIILLDLNKVHNVLDFKRKLATREAGKQNILLLVADPTGKNRRNVILPSKK
ncbi:trypsin-like peptidase domain-containing protein [Candidatus Similichlamydia laticola]|uniref:HtrA protease/chaperone protein n=1 Tax=Candidatus Similichlamydia laticola TaxID=2170265 RepID=A0A369KBL0_9BACT|nr:trypsin-like peptidase domain-containing protein [Candidatus Similichlamydia laticola]RDB31308.1 HtrA protease/chaperone protein [Candidatus Similichlamydia laticola]